MAKTEIRVGVGAIITREDGRILLGIRNVEDNKGLWELFGGLRKPGESLEASIKREVMEEAGIEVEPVRVVATYTREFPERNIRNVGLCFQCNYLSGEPHQTEFGRVAGFQWFTLAEALEQNITPYTRMQLEQYQTGF
jgi:mutator protein MutT